MTAYMVRDCLVQCTCPSMMLSTSFKCPPTRVPLGGSGGPFRWLASSLRRGALAPRGDFWSIHAHSVCSFNVENLQAPSWISVNREGSI